MDWVQVAILVAGAAVTGFTVSYMTIAAWWKSREGRNVVFLSLMILALCTIGILDRAGFAQVADVVEVVAWFGVAAAYFWRTGLLFRAQGFLLNRRYPMPNADQMPDVRTTAED